MDALLFSLSLSYLVGVLDTRRSIREGLARPFSNIYFVPRLLFCYVSLAFLCVFIYYTYTYTVRKRIETLTLTREYVTCERGRKKKIIKIIEIVVVDDTR